MVGITNCSNAPEKIRRIHSHLIRGDRDSSPTFIVVNLTRRPDQFSSTTSASATTPRIFSDSIRRRNCFAVFNGHLFFLASVFLRSIAQARPAFLWRYLRMRIHIRASCKDSTSAARLVRFRLPALKIRNQRDSRDMPVLC